MPKYTKRYKYDYAYSSYRLPRYVPRKEKYIPKTEFNAEREVFDLIERGWFSKAVDVAVRYGVPSLIAIASFYSGQFLWKIPSFGLGSGSF